jgi:CubicO group peptidase (beta-lactamase class C family)
MLTKTYLEQSTPEAQGISSAAILAFVDAVEQAELELHSMMLVRHGQVVAKGWWTPYAAETPHMLFSLSKSFTSTAVGMAVAEGLLSVDDRVVGFFPDDLPGQVDDNLAAMTVYNLLTMNTGHDKDTTGAFFQAPDGNWAKGFLSLPVEHVPGTHFVYNSGATYMLSAIVQKLTGQTLLDYLTPRLFEPLGIEGATWQSCPRGINVGGWGLKIKTDDIANFGQLYLQEGNWQGQPLISPAWVAAATSAQVPNGPSDNPDWAQGYGYQFWRCRHDAYRGDGAFGQFCVVMPDQDAVLAITSGVRNMQAVLDLAWEHLLPAMQGAPLPADAGTQAALAERLSSLNLRPQSGKATSAVSAHVSAQSYRFEESEENEDGITLVQLDFGQSGTQLTMHDRDGEHRLDVGYGTWPAGRTRLGQHPSDPGYGPVAVSGAWTDDDTYTIRLCWTETPFIQTSTLRFVDDRLELTQRANVGFGPPESLERPTLVGRKVQ